MKRLADFLRQHRDAIVATWCAEVASLPSAASQGRRGIPDHVPELLDELARALDEHAGGASLDQMAAVHAKTRFAAGYDVREVVTEYQILRRIILETYAAEAVRTSEPPGSRFRAASRLDWMIDAAICDAVDRFVAERERAKDILVGVLGHDLRAPLQSIVFSAATLIDRGDVTGASATKVGKRIRASAERMGNMIRDLLDFTRAHLGGGIPITAAPVDLAAVLDEVLEELAHAYPTRTVRRRPPAPGANLHGTWDEARIAQAVMNLVSNAIQHGRDPIEVEAMATDTTITVEVRNAGGIDPAAAGRLFTPFAHGAERANRPDGRAGLGLGLYIVSEIARAHGGTVDFDSVDDTTRFRLVLPREAPAQPMA